MAVSQASHAAIEAVVSYVWSVVGRIHPDNPTRGDLVTAIWAVEDSLDTDADDVFAVYRHLIDLFEGVTTTVTQVPA